MKPSSTLEVLTNRPKDPAAPVKRLPAWLIPAGILSGFGIFFLILFGDRLIPAPTVEVAVVLATSSDAKPGKETTASRESAARPGAAVMFQASGWIEPAPLPVKATALVDGVVENVHVLPGDQVKKDQLLATLIADDARLAHSASQQRQRTLEAALKAHLAAIAATERKIAGLEAELAAAEARRKDSQGRADRMERLPKGSVPESDVITAKFNLEHEAAQTRSASAAVEQMRAEIDRLNAETDVKRGELDAVAVEVEQTALALRRTEIKSPTDGRILRLLAAPGQKKIFASDDPDSATIAILYHPGELQVRVDTPLADAAGLRVGQPARIHCSLLPQTVLHGRVSHITGEADLQRNTLQAKVEITDPVDQLRPEMLCRVEFLEGENPAAGATTDAAESLRTWIPVSAVTGGGVWLCDPDSKRVKKLAVTATGEPRDGYIHIADGLRPGEWVVLSPGNLHDGKRVNPNISTP